MIPSQAIASIANNLPMKIDSTGIAAASTSITLDDFSSINCDSSMPASRMVRTNSKVWPILAVISRLNATDPAELLVRRTSTPRSTQVGNIRACWASDTNSLT